MNLNKSGQIILSWIWWLSTLSAQSSKQMNNIRSLFTIAKHCVLCGIKANTGFDLCAACYREIQPKPKESVCQRCALPISPLDIVTRICGNCLQEEPPYTSVYRFAHYAPPLDRIILQLKFHQKLHFARLLGNLMARDIQQQEIELPDVLMPVLLHSQRLKQRGFNQALEIARPIARSLGIPLDIQSCVRYKATMEQSGLPAKKRTTNIKGAFQVRSAKPGKHIAIVDDVMTTGSTVSELSKVLKNSGAKRVDVWVCARANL